MRVTVVIATRDRRDSLLRTLRELAALREPPPVVVVDNASGDGSPSAVATAFPEAAAIRLAHDHGSAARTVGVSAAQTPYVAFADDDSWWEAGALERAAEILDAEPRIALVAARVLLADGREDPVCAQMRAGGDEPTLFGFVACGAVVRRDAYLDAGGFHPAFQVGGEETLLALDLVARGKRLVYADDVVAHHHPSPVRDVERRRLRVARNHVLVGWFRLSRGEAIRRTVALLRAARRDRTSRRAALSLLRRLTVLRERRPVSPEVERAFLRVVGGDAASIAGESERRDVARV